MGVRYPSVFSNTFIGPLPASAAETIVCTTPPLTLPLDGATVFLLWTFSVIAGTGNIFNSFNIRRGTTLAGTAVNAGAQAGPATAASGAMYSGAYFDTPGGVAGQQYTLTVQQGGATAAGTFRDVSMLAFAL